MYELAKRVAVVTGAASGIGRGIALALAGEGMGVVVADIDFAPAAETCALAGGGAVALPLDVADGRAMEALAERVARDIGPVAGIFTHAAFRPLLEQRFAGVLAEVDRAE